MGDTLTYAIGYGRQSRAQDKDAGASLSTLTQRRSAESWCARNDATLVGWYEDVDVSGAARSRAGLDALLARIDAEPVDVVVVHDVSRLARDVRIFLDLTEHLEQRGITLVSATEPTDEAWLTIVLVAIAQRQREQTGEKSARGKREAVKLGRHIGRAPYGYRHTGQPNPIFVPHAEEAAVVRDIFEAIAAGESQSAVCRRLNAAGIRTGYGREWSRPLIRQIITRHAYCGRAMVGEKATSKIGKALGTAYGVGLWEPLVAPALWERANRVMAEATHRSRTDRHVSSWLERRAVCAHCGQPMYLLGIRPQVKGWNLDTFWRCRGRYLQRIGQERRCTAQHGRLSDRIVDRLARAALSDLLAAVVPPDVAAAQARARAKALRRPDERALLERRMAEIDRKLANLIREVEAGNLPGHLVKSRSQELEAEKRALSRAIEELPAGPDPATVRDLAAYAAGVRDLIPRADDDALRTVMARLHLQAVIDVDARAVRLCPAPDVAPIFDSSIV